MKSDSDCKTSLGELSASSCWSHKKWDCMAYRSGLHIVNIQIHKWCSFVGLAGAPLLWLSSTSRFLGECREAVAELPVQYPTQILFSQQQQNLQDTRVEALFCGCYMATSSPSGSDVSQPQGISPLATVIKVWSSVFFSSSLICLIQGNHCKCTVPSPDPTEVSDTAPVDLSGTMI